MNRNGIDSKCTNEQPIMGEGMSVHIQSFFKNLSDSLHLQEEIDDSDSEIIQKKVDAKPTTGVINKQDCQSEDDFSGYLYDEQDFIEELKDHSTMKRGEKDTIYDSTPKESHPFFDGRFVEVDGLIQYDPEWEERQKAKKKRRHRHRACAWGQNTITTKAA